MSKGAGSGDGVALGAWSAGRGHIPTLQAATSRRWDRDDLDLDAPGLEVLGEADQGDLAEREKVIDA
jgi:hypothetical protein